jgi:hypothetical protein
MMVSAAACNLRSGLDAWFFPDAQNKTPSLMLRCTPHPSRQHCQLTPSHSYLGSEASWIIRSDARKKFWPIAR